MHVFEALNSRLSVRAFTDQDVPLDTVYELLDASARAPSGTNMQPWSAYIVTGAAKERVSKTVIDHVFEKGGKHDGQYKYYPDEFPEPYLSRRRKVGWDLYGLLGIEKGDKAKMAKQHARNFTFFDAPVGIFFTIDKRLELGSWLDHGMFLGGFMLAARAKGLHTCPQAAWVGYHTQVREALPQIPDGEDLVCGMALGYADESDVTFSLETERESARNYAVSIAD